MSSLSRRVKIVEVGPRDGLQNETEPISTKAKFAFIQALAESGLQEIEATSFVHPKAIPQLADADTLASRLEKIPGVIFSALVPNQKGLERALQAGIKKIAVFTAASETFNQKNIRMSIETSLKEFEKVVTQALKAKLTVRGYISTAFVCPYEGDIPREKVLDVAEALLQIGVEEVSLGDTIGAASPRDVQETVGFILKKIPAHKLALHFHDTYGTALANTYAAMELGISTFDTSAGGLGGCPYALGAAGNLGTEDLVYMLNRMRVETGVNLHKIFQASSLVSAELKRDLQSRQWQRLKAQSADDNPSAVNRKSLFKEEP
jgi:hydroxymethylglutaryl-CoA lyase